MSSDHNESEPTARGESASAASSSVGAPTISRGAFIVVVGPDGAGKTSVAQCLLEARDGRYFHFRPPYRTRAMLRHPPLHNPPQRKDSRPVFPPFGWVRLARNVLASWIGYLIAIRPALARGELVIADRWIYGYLAQPRPLRYGGPRWLARAAIGALPSPDLVVNLSAPVDVIHGRKSELSRDEIKRELKAWQRLPAKRLVTIDTSAGLEKVIREVLSLIG